MTASSSIEARWWSRTMVHVGSRGGPATRGSGSGCAGRSGDRFTGSSDSFAAGRAEHVAAAPQCGRGVSGDAPVGRCRAAGARTWLIGGRRWRRRAERCGSRSPSGSGRRLQRSGVHRPDVPGLNLTRAKPPVRSTGGHRPPRRPQPGQPAAAEMMRLAASISGPLISCPSPAKTSRVTCAPAATNCAAESWTRSTGTQPSWLATPK